VLSSARAPRDLADFILTWSDHRDVMRRLAEDQRLTGRERTILTWLIALTDRVGPVDLAEAGAHPVLHNDTDHDRRGHEGAKGPPGNNG
jgi:hypothetical protein